MRKILSILTTAAILLAACKKEHHIVLTNNDLQNVTFAVGFSQDTSGFKTNSLKTDAIADTSITNNIEVLYYMVFDANQALVHNIKQVKTDAGFGSYTDKLHPGKYTVAIAGGKSGLNIFPGNPNNLLNQYLYYQAKAPLLQDIFFKKITLTVANAGSTQAVNLERVTSKLRLVIKDAIPATVASIKISISVYSGFGLYNESGVSDIAPQIYGGNFSFNIPASAIGTKNYTLTTASFIPYTSGVGVIPVYIQAYDATGNSVALKKIDNVTYGKNKLTILSGNLFGGAGTGGGGFVVSVPGWDTPITKTF